MSYLNINKKNVYIVSFSLILLFSLNIVLEASICPKCNFKNKAEERYCLNCFNEIRKITNEEKQSFEKVNKKRKIKVQNKLKKQIRNEIQHKKRQKLSKIQNSKQKTHIPFTGKGVNVNGVICKLGMTKKKLRHRLKYKSNIYPYSGNKWKISESYRHTYLYFNGDFLSSIQKKVYNDFYIKRKYPLNLDDIKLGQTKSMINKLWKQPDLIDKTVSNSDSHSKLSYYIKEPSKEIAWKNSYRANDSQSYKRLSNDYCKSGKVIELTFNGNDILKKINIKNGSMRKISYRRDPLNYGSF